MPPTTQTRTDSYSPHGAAAIGEGGGHSGAPSAHALPAREQATAAALAAVRRLVRSLRLAARRVEAEVGVSAAQLFVLRQLEGAPPLSLRELAARSMTDRTSVAAVVDRLVARGLVQRGRAAEDRRRATIALSADGRALLRGAPTTPTADLLAGLERLAEGELGTLATGLTRLTEVMGLEHDLAELLFADGHDTALPSGSTGAPPLGTGRRAAVDGASSERSAAQPEPDAHTTSL